VVVERTASCLLRADAQGVQVANTQLDDLCEKATAALLEGCGSSSGFSRIECQRNFRIRFDGTSTALLVSPAAPASAPSLVAAFESAYQTQFGFLLQNRAVLIDDVSVRVRGVSAMAAGSALGPQPTVFDAPYTAAVQTPSSPVIRPPMVASVFFSGRHVETKLVPWPSPGEQVAGPAILCGNDTTVVVEPRCTAYVNDGGNLVIHTDCSVEPFSTALHPLALSIFSQRFMSIAEQMGYALQRTSISTNIKERLDFSCAIFDADGNLVANAPHIPVHLGAMGAAVRWQKEHHGNHWGERDVILSNHPSAGGSHLPDITVMTPCWHAGKPIFYVASRGHHADVGGCTPGSMPPFSTSLHMEGVPIKTFRLVEGGVFQDAGIRAVLSGKNPDVTGGAVDQGCRAIEDNVSDLQAQVAANHRGVELVKDLIASYGVNVVLSYMKHIQAAAEGAARAVLRSLGARFGCLLHAEDFMDDGTSIRLQVRIDPSSGGATFDFTGTGPQVMASTNCPTAVVHSAIIYAIRCLVRSEIPLNQGCMAPVTVVVPKASILAPEEDCAVVAGNVLTSQRVTDVIFTALRASACSQGCMNNFTMGNSHFGYYETICGGMGAGEGFDGASAVQCHMTNTRITDPELLEQRYPVLLRNFAVRRGTGGKGKNRGGDGVTRSMLFLDAMTVCLLTERRAVPPRGICGGLDGCRGSNVFMMRVDPAAHTMSPSAMLRLGGQTQELLWQTECDGGRDGSLFGSTGVKNVFSCRSLGGKNIVEARRGDVVIVHTPGGGGFGSADIDGHS
jgi:5-oxoprolinase (ATP-hydrolysing)